MPENNLPASNPDPETMPGEFDFTQPPTITPRVKRRSFRTQSTPLKPTAEIPPAARELAHEAPPLSNSARKPQPVTDTHEDDEEEIKPAPVTTRPAPAATKPSQPSPGTTSTRPASTPHQPASPHGTRPATLYYSQRKIKEETPTMKPTTSPASSTPASTTTTTPTRTTAPASTSSIRPSTVADYRANMERQSREQKSVGNVLAILVYTLAGLFLLGTGLAGYGAYVVHQALHDQSQTVSQLEARYDAENKDLTAKLDSTQATLAQAQASINRQQELILKQQDTINKIVASLQDTSTALRQERQARADETASLRARVKGLENLQYHGQTTHQY